MLGRSERIGKISKGCVENGWAVPLFGPVGPVSSWTSGSSNERVARLSAKASRYERKLREAA